MAVARLAPQVAPACERGLCGIRNPAMQGPRFAAILTPGR